MTKDMNSYRIGKQIKLVALAALFLAPVWAWGQTNYSGIYYIASNYQDLENNAHTLYDPDDLEDNLYLCPTEPTTTWNWYYDDPNKAVNNNTGKFFMTTYRCHTSGYPDERNAVWIVEKHPSQNYYYIKRAIDNSYLTYNGSITSPSGIGANRMRVHTETVTPDPNNSAHDIYLFAITPYGSNGSVDISPKSAINLEAKYLNINKGNKNSLVGDGSPEPSSGSTQINLGGIVGLWKEQQNFSEWYLEKATVDPPTITNNFNGTISITAETGATIYYTTDGTDPTTSSSTYSTAINLTDAITVIKAIAKGASDYFPSLVTTYNIPVCERPVITVSNSMATITCVTSGASIFYTTNGDPATTSSTPYAYPFSTVGVDVISAIATSPGYIISNVAFYYPSIEVSSSDEITNMYGHYLLLDGFTSSAPIGDANHPFRGQIDGNYVPFSLNGHALIGVAEDAVIKNVVVSSVTYSGSGNVGAIVNTAKGGTKIYNCGVRDGSVGGGTNTGGLVGLIEDGSSVRVVNCYNFANVSGSSYAAGIVGKNEGDVSTDRTAGNVRIALCMMYGNVTGATNISPVYCGNHVSNSENFTEYNYWRYRSGMQYTAYNDQMAIERDDFLTRFPFYIHILNTHREMAAFFLFGGMTCNDMVDITDDHIAEIGHWVLKKDVAAFPIIEPWPTDTKKVLDAPTPSNILTEMGGTGTNAGYLKITVKIGNNTYTTYNNNDLKLPITDMDEENFDYTWGKVVLPFANEFEVNTDYSKVCTGWKITSVSPAGQESFENYNVSNRKCTTKDLYSTTGFIFAQGGNYIVPYGVTAITIEANFANAIYLCDESYDIAYEKDSNTVPPQTSGSNPSGYMTRTTLAGSTPSSFTDGQNVYTIHHTLAAALDAMGNSNTTHAQAIVLLGNYHLDDFDLTQSSRTKKGYTIMSIDADNNQEPDYAIYSNNTMDRPAVPPTRYDFVAFIPLGMSSHVYGAFFYPNTPIWKPRGWFEITETGLMFANQFEIDSKNFNENGTMNCRCIINGGYFTQMVRSNQGNCTKLSYYQLGGKAYVKEFYPGNHSAKTYANKLVPINVTGGEIEQCFMTGYGKDGGKAYGPNIYFWCAGGKIHKFLGAYMEPPVETSSSTFSDPGTVNLTAKIDHAIIGRFFGGGTTSKACITGDINVTIDNSKVDFYCGGPEFGDMTSGKTVTTHATNTTFGEYYGAGFGGTAITYKFNIDNGDVTLAATVPYPGYFSTYYLSNSGRLRYLTGFGLGNCYKSEYLMHSRGHRGVARFYTGYASFSLATAGDVTNVLEGCTVLNSFYGAGCQGKVDGKVTSTLKDCTVLGSAFGGGYKAEANEVDVYPTTEPSPLSVFTAETGIFSDFGTVEPETYTWKQGTPQQQNTADATNHIFYTSEDITMSDLGNVTGDIKITLNGNTTVNGNVFGGGNESKSLANTLVEILGHTKVLGNIYGGGNMAVVGGNTKVVVNGQNGNAPGNGTNTTNPSTND